MDDAAAWMEWPEVRGELMQTLTPDRINDLANDCLLETFSRVDGDDIALFELVSIFMIAAQKAACAGNCSSEKFSKYLRQTADRIDDGTISMFNEGILEPAYEGTLQ